MCCDAIGFDLDVRPHRRREKCGAGTGTTTTKPDLQDTVGGPMWGREPMTSQFFTTGAGP